MKLGYIHIPKTGGTFLSKYLNLYTDIKVYGHKKINDILEKEIYLFSTIRNPFDWYVSRYHYYTMKGIVEKGISKGNDFGINNQAFKETFKTFKDYMIKGSILKANNQLSRWYLTDIYKYQLYLKDNLID